MSIDELLKMPTRRDQWGRYKVLSPEGKVKGYTRATTVAKALDDGAGLLGWGKRMVALGLAQRPDLVALVASIGPDDKKALDGVCERAAEAGGSTIRRDLGTALHAALEESWVDMAKVPAPFVDDVAAVHSTLKAAGLSVVSSMIERMVVMDRFEIAGTFDLIVTDGEHQDGRYLAWRSRLRRSALDLRQRRQPLPPGRGRRRQRRCPRAHACP